MLLSPDLRRLLIMLGFLTWLLARRSSAPPSSKDSRLALASISRRIEGTGGAAGPRGVASNAWWLDPMLILDMRRPWLAVNVKLRSDGDGCWLMDFRDVTDELA